MSERLYVGTRKGLFELRRNAAGQWLPMRKEARQQPRPPVDVGQH
ncbi:hypothetical protein ACLBUN_29985, partial [Pseudomonas aeruginosa]